MCSLDAQKGQIELSLRSPKNPNPSLDFRGPHALHTGQVVDGRIKKVQPYGLFIEIKNTSISGLCHKSEVRLPEVQGPSNNNNTSR